MKQAFINNLNIKYACSVECKLLVLPSLLFNGRLQDVVLEIFSSYIIHVFSRINIDVKINNFA